MVRGSTGQSNSARRWVVTTRIQAQMVRAVKKNRIAQAIRFGALVKRYKIPMMSKDACSCHLSELTQIPKTSVKAVKQMATQTPQPQFRIARISVGCSFDWSMLP